MLILNIFSSFFAQTFPMAARITSQRQCANSRSGKVLKIFEIGLKLVFENMSGDFEQEAVSETMLAKLTW